MICDAPREHYRLSNIDIIGRPSAVVLVGGSSLKFVVDSRISWLKFPRKNIKIELLHTFTSIEKFRRVRPNRMEIVEVKVVAPSRWYPSFAIKF